MLAKDAEGRVLEMIEEGTHSQDEVDEILGKDEEDRAKPSETTTTADVDSAPAKPRKVRKAPERKPKDNN